MNKFYRVLFVFIFGGCIGAHAQQQFTYTQFIDNLTPINPAWSLTREGGAVNILSRKQWINIDGAPSTFMANGYAPIKSINATFGFTMLSDKVAIENLTEFNLFFAKSIKLFDDGYLSTAINGGFRNYSALYSTLDPNDPALVNTDIRENRGNVGASVLFYIPGKLYAGVSLPRLSFQNLGQGSVASSLHEKNFYFLNMGYTYKITDDLEWDNATVVAYTYNVPLQADVSTKIWVKNAFGAGLNYRAGNELAFLSSYKSRNIRAGYSYQFGFGGTRVAGFDSATHEITLGLRFGGSDARDGSGWW